MAEASKTDFMSVSSIACLTQFESLMSAPSEDVAISQLTSTVQSMGFDQMLIAIVPKPSMGTSDAYLKSNYPESWRASYDQRGLGAYDPTVAHCFKSKLPFVWTPESFRTEEQRSLYDEAASIGLRAGVTLPIHGPKGEVGMLTCVRDQSPDLAFMQDLSQCLGNLTLLRDVAFESLSAHVHAAEQVEEIPDLTARELDCLQWLAAGKTAWEIGRILSISESGVNFHISNLRNKFGVTRRNDVVVKAIRMGLISLP